MKIHKALHLVFLIGISLISFTHCQSQVSSENQVETADKVKGIDLDQDSSYVK